MSVAAHGGFRWPEKVSRVPLLAPGLTQDALSLLSPAQVKDVWLLSAIGQIIGLYFNGEFLHKGAGIPRQRTGARVTIAPMKAVPRVVPRPTHPLTGFGYRDKHSRIPPPPAGRPWAAVPGTSLGCESPHGTPCVCTAHCRRAHLCRAGWPGSPRHCPRHLTPPGSFSVVQGRAERAAQAQLLGFPSLAWPLTSSPSFSNSLKLDPGPLQLLGSESQLLSSPPQG